MTDTSRFIALDHYVAGRELTEEAFATLTRPVPEPGEGEVVVRPVALSCDPYMRGCMTGIDTFFLPQFELGKPIESFGVGRVVASRRDGIGEGQLVQGLMQWGDHSLWSPRAGFEGEMGLTPLDPGIAKPSHALGVFGLNGLTALFGMLGVAKPEPGDTVLVSAAAGGIGSIAGQVAKIVGATVVGLASSQEKREVLTGELGFDAALDYRSDTLGDDLLAVMPRGPDIYFDNVGGETSQKVMRIMRRHTRVVECGQISTYDDDDAGWTVDIRPIHSNGLIWESYTTAHFTEFFPGGLAQLMHWVRVGKLKVVETEFTGLEQAPAAMAGLFRGHNVGKMVVTIPEG